MLALINITGAPPRRVLDGHGEHVSFAYWAAAAVLLAGFMLRLPLEGPSAALAATGVFIVGGLPHGAYDISLIRRTGVVGGGAIIVVVLSYVILALLMSLLWSAAPLLALAVFLVIAAVHFGEDWAMLEEPLLRVAAGLAVIAAPAMSHQADVAALFIEMSDPRAVILAQVITAAAPVTLLVTSVGVAVAWSDGNRAWAAAMASCLAMLILLPPVIAFALFFVFLHSPRHLAQARHILRTMSTARWLTTGVLLSGGAIFGWIAVQRIAGLEPWRHITPSAFQLLASVAVPHLLLSRWLERRITSATV